ncbi:hypothetical protein [Paraburkholderia susongensis]|uniref:hypothetical protein n=1 Tax=Paraburkholderia susongensis TaxID=1515439 RepID=UPI0011811B74|nr:hypothetical protein [Paraburkholderia susongensis]
MKRERVLPLPWNSLTGHRGKPVTFTMAALMTAVVNCEATCGDARESTASTPRWNTTNDQNESRKNGCGETAKKTTGGNRRGR